MSVAKRIEILSKVGEKLQDKDFVELLAQQAYSANAWFEPRFVQQALDAVSRKYLNAVELSSWLKPYHLEDDIVIKQTVGIICAGNVPLVGFHDFLCCYVLGVPVQLKLSTRDTVLMRYVIDAILREDKTYAATFAYVERLSNFDAVIATGSGSTNRYFEYYFSKYPNILRSNRVSVAVLRGNETTAELEALADDVFLHFGLGCRNVSKIFLPVGYDVQQLFPAFARYQWLHNNSQYMNNYDYNRTLLLMNSTPHLSNDFVMLQEKDSLHSPIATLFYAYYSDANLLKEQLLAAAPKIQCVVGSAADEIPFGQAQQPSLHDYADQKDTIGFLLSL